MKNGPRKSLFDQLVLALIVGLAARTVMLIDDQFAEIKSAIDSLAKAFKEHEKDEKAEIGRIWKDIYQRQVPGTTRSRSNVK